MRPLREKVTADTDIACLLPFVVGARRTRWKELLSSSQGRKKLLAKLWNGEDLDRLLMVRLKRWERSTPVLLTKLKDLGAPSECYLISARPALDGKNLDLPSALRMVVDLAPGTIISCIPGKLAYYENDDRNGSYIIHLSSHSR